MRDVERVGDVAQQVDGPLRAQPLLGVEHVAEIDPVDVFHRDVEQAVGLTGVEDRDDVGVVEARCCLRLTHEALAEAAIAGQVGGEHLERDDAGEVQVLGTEHHTHAAPARQRLDLVAGEFLPDLG